MGLTDVARGVAAHCRLRRPWPRMLHARLLNLPRRSHNSLRKESYLVARVKRCCRVPCQTACGVGGRFRALCCIARPESLFPVRTFSAVLLFGMNWEKFPSDVVTARDVMETTDFKVTYFRSNQNDRTGNTLSVSVPLTPETVLTRTS